MAVQHYFAPLGRNSGLCVCRVLVYKIIWPSEPMVGWILVWAEIQWPDIAMAAPFDLLWEVVKNTCCPAGHVHVRIARYYTIGAPFTDERTLYFFFERGRGGPNFYFFVTLHRLPLKCRDFANKNTHTVSASWYIPTWTWPSFLGMATPAQRLRAIHLYRHSLKNMLSWVVRRDAFYTEVGMLMMEMKMTCCYPAVLST